MHIQCINSITIAYGRVNVTSPYNKTKGYNWLFKGIPAKIPHHQSPAKTTRC